MDDLNAMGVFATVAELRGFRAAGDRLGVSASAVSQTIRKLEKQVGIALLHRTTRSVRLTEAGERMYAGLRPALEHVRATMSAVGALSDAPSGRLRLLVGTAADAVLGGPLLIGFLSAHPLIELDLVVSDEAMDIVAGGFDAGIQLGEWITRDMVVRPVGGMIRMLVVGAPSYFARHAIPLHPHDLLDHACINWHQSATMAPYKWEFTERGREITIAVPARVLSTDSSVNIRLARAGLGITIVFEDQVRDELARGELQVVLEDFSEPFPGYFLYYPDRGHASPALRALVKYLSVETSRPHVSLNRSALRSE